MVNLRGPACDAELCVSEATKSSSPALRFIRGTLADAGDSRGKPGLIGLTSWEAGRLRSLESPELWRLHG